MKIIIIKFNQIINHCKHRQQSMKAKEIVKINGIKVLKQKNLKQKKMSKLNKSKIERLWKWPKLIFFSKIKKKFNYKILSNKNL